MIIYYETEQGIDTGTALVPKTHPHYSFVLDEIKNNAEIVLKKRVIVETQPPETWDSIRAKRDQLLKDSDWSVLPDAPTRKKQWMEYRAKLRQITTTFSAPGDVIWPTKPV